MAKSRALGGLLEGLFFFFVAIKTPEIENKQKNATHIYGYLYKYIKLTYRRRILLREKEIQKEVRKFIKNAEWRSPVAATLTLKKGISCDGFWVPVDRLHASAALKYAMNIMDRKIYGNRVRNGSRVKRFPVFEGGEDGVRLHYHLLLDVPEHTTFEILSKNAADAWSRTQWGYDINHFAECDLGWVRYITKLRTKKDFASCIDWVNVTIRP